MFLINAGRRSWPARNGLVYLKAGASRRRFSASRPAGAFLEPALYTWV